MCILGKQLIQPYSERCLIISTTSAPVRRPRPYLALTLTTIGLVVFLGAVGTISYLLGFPGYLPLAAAYIPLTAAIIISLSVRRRWHATGFCPVDMKRSGVRTAMVLVAALPIGVIVSSGGFAANGMQIIEFAGLALLVGFVEETIFRGILLPLFTSRSPWVGVVATSVGFAVAHSAAALSPDQSLAVSITTVVFAFLFGVIAATLVRKTGSIWTAIALHATFDFVGFVLTPRSVEITNTVSIVVAAALILILVRASRQRTGAPRLEGSETKAPLPL
jgi:membrane protease YdiL (CAAX protease family)